MRKVVPRPASDWAAGATVGLSHRRNDREPETGASVRPRPRRIGTVETLENALEHIGRHAGACIRDLDHGVRVLPRDGDLHRHV